MFRLLLSISFLLSGFQTILGNVITVGENGDFETLSDVESILLAGDTVIILNGTYSNGTQFLEDLSGTEEAPIVIKAESLHDVIFSGGTEGIHLINCVYIVVEGLLFENQTGNAMNIDDGGDYTTPAHHITIRDCIFQNIDATGNNDLLKLSGLDSFLIEDCVFQFGAAGSGVDMVGCHWGTIQSNYFLDTGNSGIQAKGGTQFITIRKNTFEDLDQRALNLGGSTGLEFFRPPLPDPIVDAFEAADLDVYSNVFVGSWSPIAYVGCVRVKVYNNTIYKPENWVIRILQETTEEGFLTCGDNEFRNNIIYLSEDLTEVNIGPDTDDQSFVFSNNTWFNEDDDSWSPSLPVEDVDQIIEDPLFVDGPMLDFHLDQASPCIESGTYFEIVNSDFDGYLFYDPPSSGAFEGHESTLDAHIEVEFNTIKVYPNPSTNQVKVEGDFANADIKVIDSMGNVLSDYSNVENELIIDIEALPQGIYLIQIQSLDYESVYLEKIIKN